MEKNSKVKKVSDNVVKRVMKGSEVYQSDLFEADIKDYKKNKSYRKYQPEIERIPHKHFFRTYDSSGKKQLYCSTNAGHRHPVKISIEDGEFVANCGPAERKVTIIKRTGESIERWVPVVYKTDMEGSDIVDAHTHEFRYKNSENIHPRLVKPIEGQQRVIGIEHA